MAKNQPGRMSNKDLRATKRKLDNFEQIKEELGDFKQEFEDLVDQVTKTDTIPKKSREDLTKYLNDYASLKEKLNNFFNQDNEQIRGFISKFKDALSDIDQSIKSALASRDDKKEQIAVLKEEIKKAILSQNKAKEDSLRSELRQEREALSNLEADYKVKLKQRHDYYSEYQVILNHVKKVIDKSQNSARILKTESDRFIDRHMTSMSSLIKIAANPQDLENFSNNLKIKARKRLNEPELVDAFETFIDNSLANSFSQGGQFRDALIKLIGSSILKTLDKHFTGILKGGNFNVPFMGSFLPSFQSASIESILKERMQGPASLYKEYGKDFADGANIMKEITKISYKDEVKNFGITQKEIGKAFGELNKQMSEFTSKYSEPMREELGKAVVMLEKAGVATATTVKAFSTLTKTFFEERAMPIIKNMAALGKAMNVNDKVIQDLTSNSGKLAHLNKDKLEKSIIDLSIASTKMNVEVSSLLAQISNFQTFEGAASAAAELNIALGGQFVDGLMLMKDAIDAPEKALFRLKSAFEQSGKSVDSLDPAQLKYFASAFKLSEEEFRRVFKGSTRDLYDFSKAMKTKAESEQKFVTMMKKSRDVFTEVANAFFGAFNDESLEALISITKSFGSFMTIIAKFIDFFPIMGVVITATLMKIVSSAVLALSTANKLGIHNVGNIKNIASSIAPTGAAGVASFGSKVGSSFLSPKSLMKGGAAGALMGGISMLAKAVSGEQINGSDIGSFIGGILGGIAGTAFGPVGTLIGATAGNMIGGGIGSLFTAKPPIEDGIIVSRDGETPHVIPINSDDSVRLIASKPNGPIEQNSSKGNNDTKELENLMKLMIQKMDEISKRPLEIELDGKKLSGALYDLNRRNAYNR